MRFAAAILALALIAQPALAQPAGDWRVPDPENVLVIDTNQGRIIVEMVPAAAPRHVERLKTLARRGFYDGLTFFRVIDDFMAQTGDPRNTGEGESDLPNLGAEFSFWRGPETPVDVVSPGPVTTGFVGPLPVITQPDDLMVMMANKRVSASGLFCPGVLGMARAEDINSGNSQFFLMRAAFPSLNGKYTAFGRVISGLDVVRKIKTGEPVPQPQDRMTKVQVLADIPAADRPQIQVANTAGPTFKAYAEGQRAARGAGFDICNLEIPASVR